MHRKNLLMFFLDKNTLKLLRIPFSFFLMPVYFFAIATAGVNATNYLNAITIFLVLHLFIYPASNGYNSFMDEDEGSIGGLRNPPKVTQNLFYASILFDIFGLALAFYVGVYFFVGILIYMLISRAYSWKGIRLKKYPIIGFLSVVVFQGFFTFLNIYFALITDFNFSNKVIIAGIAASCMIGGVYPLTQIYQHKQDAESGDKTISILLGYRGTFMFSLSMFLLAGLSLFFVFSFMEFIYFQVFLFPVAIFFGSWMLKVWKNTNEASFDNTMKMNMIASICMNLFFVFLIFIH